MKIFIVTLATCLLMNFGCARSDGRDGLDKLEPGRGGSPQPRSGFSGGSRSDNDFDPRNTGGGNSDRGRYQPKVPPADGGNVDEPVEFRIPAGTGEGAWNTEADMLELTQGFGLRLVSEQSAVTFALNSSNLSYTNQETFVTYRLGYVYIGGGFSHSVMSASLAGEDFLELSARGYGATTGGFLPVSRGGMVTLDVAYVTGNGTLEGNQKTVTYGPRMDVTLGGLIDLTRESLDLAVGFRYRTLALSVDSTAYSEIQSTTFLGLQWGFNF